MSILLDLPFELRALIIEYVLYTPLSPPVTPLESEAMEYHDLEYRAWQGGGGKAYYHKSQSKTTFLNCLSLLLTNRQISTETRVILGNKNGKVNYVLDVSVKNDLDVFLTWLSVPCLTTHVSTLYADVRVFGHIIEKRTVRNQLGDGGRLGFHWLFYAALERFLRYGPVGEKKRKGENEAKPPRYGYGGNIQEFEDRGMLIDTLVLDFSSAETELTFPPEDIGYRHWWCRHWGRDRLPRDQGVIPENLSSYTSRPEWLCEYLRGWISGLLAMSYHTSSYGMPLYEQIGTIRILVDGQLHTEFDLAARLAGLRFTGPHSTMGHLSSDQREAGCAKWKEQTLRRREAQGFPVKEAASDDEQGWGESTDAGMI
ncbi:hypothetical protein PoHVEF18_007682 [Penicillium ochrochloron]